MAATFLEYSKTTLQRLIKKISSPTSKDIIKGLYLNYDEITLKLYYEVAATSDFKKLFLVGTYSEDHAAKAWEEIIRDNCKATNSRKYIILLDAQKKLNQYINEQSYLKAAITKLHFEIDRELIADIEKDFHFTFNLKNSAKYAQSLKELDNRAKGWNTKIAAQKIMIERLMKEEEGKAKGKSVGFQQSLVRVGTALNIVVPQDVLLATFNEYINVIKEREARNRKAA
jgi:hypothetical protein